VRNRDTSVKELDLIVGCSDACLMRFDAVETTAIGNLFVLPLAAVSTAPFFRMVNSSPGALGMDAIEEVGRL
jgi:hypothetical protein